MGRRLAYVGRRNRSGLLRLLVRNRTNPRFASLGCRHRNVTRLYLAVDLTTLVEFDPPRADFTVDHAGRLKLQATLREHGAGYPTANDRILGRNIPLDYPVLANDDRLTGANAALDGTFDPKRALGFTIANDLHPRPNDRNHAFPSLGSWLFFFFAHHVVPFMRSWTQPDESRLANVTPRIHREPILPHFEMQMRRSRASSVSTQRNHFQPCNLFSGGNQQLRRVSV